MDRKITELDSIEQIQGDEYFVIASKQYNEDYKVKISNFIEQMDFVTVDDELSLISTNPVQNKVITEKLNEIDDRLDIIETGNDNNNDGTNSNIDFDLRVSDVETQTIDAGQNADVEIVDLGKDDQNIKSISFKFSIPKGEKGEKGEKGDPGPSGDAGIGSFGYRTIFAFKHSETKPSKPVGGNWDPLTNEITYPEGWSGSDDLVHPIYMSNATFGKDGIVGEWSDPIMVSSGESDGSDSKAQEFIYKLSDKESNKPEKPENNQLVDDYVPREEGWEDHPTGVSFDNQCEWVCTRSYDDSQGVWNDWEGPALWSKYGANGKDGDGVEYIYQLSSKYNRPATPGKIPASGSPTDYQEREFVPEKADTDESPWTDNPSDVTISMPYEWVSVRKFNWSTQLWEDFEEPTLWAKYGKDGDEAVAAFKSLVFRRTNSILTDADTPSGGNYADPIPDSPVDAQGNRLWSDGIPDGSEIVWMSSRIFTADGEYPQQAVWTTPKQMTDTASFDVEFSSKENPGPLVGHPNTNKEDWSDTSDSTTIWMATSTMVNGEWSDWQKIKIKGEKGDAGTSIQILGSYDSYESLIDAWNNGTLPGNNPPNTGDCYLVNGELYIWDGDSWFNAGSVKGTPGKGIKQIDVWYQVHTSSTDTPTGEWLKNSPATDSTNKYLWKKTTITYTNVEDEATDDTTFYEVIGVHGDKGIDGNSIEYIFCLTKTDEAPSVPTYNSPIESNSTKGSWTDDALGPDATWKYEWISSHVKSWNEETGEMVWGPYSDATHWAVYSEDGRGIKSIIAEYAVHSLGEDSVAGLGGLAWQSSSPAVNNDFPYLWKRTKIEFTTGDVSDAWQYEMIGKLGDKGIDGDSVEFVFKLTTDNEVPNKPSAGSITSNTPGQWTDDPLTMMDYDGVSYKYQWVSQRTKENEIWGEYSTPSLWSELYPGLYLHIKYSNDIENKIFTDNNGEDVGKYIGVLTDYNIGDSGEFDDYTWRKFQGDDGFGREYIFQLGNDYSNPPTVPTENEQTEQFVPDGWSADPIIPTTSARYCWACHRDYRNNEWGNWSGNSTNTSKAYLFSMYAESVKGETGQDGPILFPAGYWESGKSYEQILREDGSVQATPYVYDTNDETYYYLIADVQSSTRPANDTIHWKKMSTFNAIYTDILLANNAKVGQAVFNGNYMFSQNGINANGDPTTGTEYQHFNHSNPYLETNAFRPNLCFNLVTGEAWFGAGAIHLYKDGTGAISMSSGYDQEAMGTLGTFITQNKLEFANAAVRFRVGDEYQDKGVFAVSSAITDSDGGATEKITINVFADGSGYIGQNQEIYWGTDGVVHIGGLKITNEGIGTDTNGPLSKSVFIGKNGIISAGTITNELVVSTNYQRINTLRYDGESLSVESTGTAPNGGNPDFSNLVYFRFEDVIFKVTRFGIEGSKDGGNTWVDLLEGGGSSSGGNVEFVNSLPSSPDSNKLYVLV